MIKQSFNGYHYVLMILDDFTFHAWPFNLKKKSDTIIHARQFIAYAKNQHNGITNGRIFIGTTAVFDETYFPCCPDGKQRHFTELGDEPPTENRYLDNPIDQSDDNFGDQPLFPTENDNHPPSSPPSSPEVPEVPDQDTEHPSHTQENPPVPPPQWCDEDAPRHGTRQRTVKSHPDSVYGDRTPVNLQ